MQPVRRALAVGIVTVVAVVGGAAVGPASPARAAAGIGAPVELPLLPPATAGIPTAISDSGAVVGFQLYGNMCQHLPQATRWSVGTTMLLYTPQDRASRAYAVNNTGVAVGYWATYENPTFDYCPPHPQAVAWAVDGSAMQLAPGYAGETIATGVNDIGEIVGLALPHGSSDAIAVRFAGGQVLPLAEGLTGRPYPAWKPWENTNPGPFLTNLPSGNIVVDSATGPSGELPYAIALDAGAAVPLGFVRWLTPAPLSWSITLISGDGNLISAGNSVWRWIYRSGHPGYKSAPPLPDLKGGRFTAQGVSSDAKILVGDSGSGSAAYLTEARQYVPFPSGSILTGADAAGRVIGVLGPSGAAVRPVVWQISGF